MMTPAFRPMPPRWFLLVLAVLASLSFAGDVFAQAANDPSGQLENGILNQIQTASQAWAPILQRYARSLFWLLAAIEFFWSLWPLAFRGADLGEIFSELIRVVLVIGFFAFLMEGSVSLATAVVDSMQTAAGQASGLGKELRPGQILDRGVNLAMIIMDTDVGVNPLTAVPAAIAVTVAGAIILLCFCFIAALTAVTLVESWIIIYGGVIFMGFGGARWTREFALAVFKYALSVGAKLFVMILIVGVVSDVTVQWSNAYEANPDKASMWTMVALAAICAYLTKTIPDLIQGMINGTSYGGGGQLGAMAAGTMAGALAATGMVKAMAAASGGGGGGGGPGSLASKLQSSLAGGGDRAAGAAPAASSSAGGSSAATAGPAPGAAASASSAGSSAAPVGSRLGGGASAAPAPAPGGSADKGGSNAASSATASGDADKGEDKAAPAQGQQTRSTGATAASATASAAEVSLRALGSMAALSVPGMEGAPGLVASAAPPSFGSGGEGEGSAPSRSDRDGDANPPENVIRPAGPVPEAAPVASAPPVVSPAAPGSTPAPAPTAPQPGGPSKP